MPRLFTGIELPPWVEGCRVPDGSTQMTSI